MSQQIIDWLTVFFVLVSSIVSFTAGVGLLRFPDLISRQHAGAKPQTLGVIAMVIAVGLQNPSLGVITMLFLVIAFQMFTQPVSSHMISRTGYRTKHLKPELLITDELKDEIDKAERRDQIREERREKQREYQREQQHGVMQRETQPDPQPENPTD